MFALVFIGCLTSYTPASIHFIPTNSLYLTNPIYKLNDHGGLLNVRVAEMDDQSSMSF